MTTTPEVVARCPATARQIDSWASLGLVPGQPRRPGSGQWREWTEEQAGFVEAMAHLVDSGLTPRAAARCAEHLVLGRSTLLGPFVLAPPLVGAY